MENTDLGTYGGIIFIVVALIGAVKKLFRAWIDGKEPLLALTFTLSIGIAAKAAGMFGAHDVKTWLLHIVALIMAAAGAGLVHDKIVDPVLANKQPPSTGAGSLPPPLDPPK